MSTEQILLAGYVALAGVIATLFKLLLAERQARLEFVLKQLNDSAEREATHKGMLQSILDVTRAQVSGALPGPGK